VPIRKMWKSATVGQFAISRTGEAARARLTIDHITVEQVGRMALMHQQDPDQDQPLRRAQHRPDPVLPQGQQGQDGEPECEAEEVEKVARAAGVSRPRAEKVAGVHLADHDVGHGPRGAEEVRLPYARMAAREVEDDKGDDGEDKELV